MDFMRFPALELTGQVGQNVRDYLAGDLNGRMQGRFAVAEGKLLPESVNLAGDLEFSDGLVHATSLLDDITKYLGDRKDLTEIKFKTLAYDLLVQDGRYNIDNLALDGPDTDWRGKGWIAFDGQTQLNLGVKFPKTFKPDLGALSMLVETQRGADGRIALDLDLTGKINKPKVTLNMSQQNEALEEGLKTGVKGILDKLKGR
jgi:AsmA-like protein